MRIQIISHRGYWKEKSERNQAIAFHRSFDLGMGTETDVRDVCGKLCISHDMPTGQELSLDDLLDIMGGRNLPLAINIKADGLAETIKARFEAYGHTNWFVFDMSVPDMRQYLHLGIPTYTRLSEVETQAAWLEEAHGIWLDSFHGEWFSNTQIRALLDTGKRVCIVSPELHGRSPHTLWRQLLALQEEAPQLMQGLAICTDTPEKLPFWQQ